MIGFDCHNATEPLRGDSLFFIWYSFNQSQRWKIALALELPSSFEPETPGLGIQSLRSCLKKGV